MYCELESATRLYPRKIRAICGLMIFSFPEKKVLTPSRGFLQDRRGVKMFRRLPPRAPPDPLFAGQATSERFARTTENTSMKIYLKKFLSGQVTLMFANDLDCRRTLWRRSTLDEVIEVFSQKAQLNGCSLRSDLLEPANR
jgi:hypothetical protein